MIITAKVKTNKKSFSITKKNDTWIISVVSPPEKNKANIEIVKKLSKIYGSAKILSGLTSDKKVIEIY